MQLNTKGLIIRETITGEQNKIITVLTADYGVINACVFGAKKIQSRSGSGTQLFSYSELSFNKKNDKISVDSAKPVEVFFELRNDIEKIALAQYFAQLEEEFAPKNEQAEEYLRLILNSFSLMISGKRNLDLIKSVFEIYILALSGYMPDVIGCNGCGCFEDDEMFFDTQSGKICCKKCQKSGSGMLVNMDVIKAIRHICFSEPKKIFNFALPEKTLKILSEVSEKYLKNITQKNFKTLEFFHTIFE